MIPFVDGASPSFCFASLRVPFVNRASQSYILCRFCRVLWRFRGSVIGFGKVGIGFCRLLRGFFCGQGFGVWGL